MRYLPYLLLSCMAWGQAATLVKNPPCLDSNGIVFQTSGNVARPTGTPLPMCEWVKPVAPKPMDVPAIRLKDRITQTDEIPDANESVMELCKHLGGNFSANRCQYTWKQYSCADKSRVLLHDEQNPPKYWCHRVED